MSSVDGCGGGGDDGGYPPSLRSILVPHSWSRGDLDTLQPPVLPGGGDLVTLHSN